MKPKADVKILHNVAVEEFSWAETNDPKNRDDDTTNGFSETFKDCTTVDFASKSTFVGGADYAFSSKAGVGTIQVYCDTTDDEWVIYEIDIANLNTLSWPMFACRVMARPTQANLQIRGIFTTAGTVTIYNSTIDGDPTEWGTIRKNLYHLVGNDTLEKLHIVMEDNPNTYAGGWLYGYIDWIRVFKIRGWSQPVATAYDDGVYWNNDGVLKLRIDYAGAIAIDKTVPTFNIGKYPYVAIRARGRNGGSWSIQIPPGNGWYSGDNSEFETFVLRWGDFSGTINSFNTTVRVRAIGDPDEGAEIDWIAICTDPLEVSKDGRLEALSVERSRENIGSYTLQLSNPRIERDSLFHDDIEWTQNEDENYNNEDYREAGWQCAGTDNAHWNEITGTGTRTSGGDILEITVTTGPYELSHTPKPFLNTNFFDKLKVRQYVNNASATFQLSILTAEGNWYAPPAWSNTEYRVRFVNLKTLCNGERIAEIRVRVTGDGYKAFLDYVKIYRNLTTGVYNGRIKRNDLVIIQLSSDGETYEQAMAGYVDTVDESETRRILTVSGKSRAVKYREVLEHEVYFATTGSDIAQDLAKELGGYIREEKFSEAPADFQFYEVRSESYYDALKRLADSVIFQMGIDDNWGVSFDAKYPKLIEDRFGLGDTMWREFADAAVSGGAEQNNWDVNTNEELESVDSDDSFAFHERWIDRNFEMEISWKRNASVAGYDLIYFLYQNNRDHYRIKMDYGTGAIKLEKVVDSAVTNLDTFSMTLSAGTAYLLKVIVEDGNIYIFLDNELLLVASDSTFTEGWFGFYTYYKVLVDYVNVRAIGSDHIIIETRDVASSSYRADYGQIRNYLWVWGKPQTDSRTIFASAKNQQSIDRYGVVEELVTVSSTGEPSILKAKAETMIDELKDPIIELGVGIFGNPTLKESDIILFEGEGLGGRDKYLLDGLRHRFNAKGFFTELMLVKH